MSISASRDNAWQGAVDALRIKVEDLSATGCNQTTYCTLAEDGLASWVRPARAA